MATIATAHPAARRPSGIMDWLTTVDHKKIGIMYVITCFSFFVAGVVLAEIMRAELFEPGGQFVSAEQYNQLFTIHGSTMIFLFVIPMLAGLANYAVPLMIGARDMAFPRLNALSFWLLLFGGSDDVFRLPGQGRGGGEGLDQLRPAEQQGFLPVTRHRSVADRRCLSRHLVADRRGEFHRHDPEAARAGHDADEDAAVRLDGAGHGLHDPGRDAGPDRRGRDAAAGSQPGHAVF